jgi:hypothetical protein
MVSSQPPPLDLIKINLDGAFHANRDRGGWGYLACDHSSNAFFASAMAIGNVGEALAS